MALMVCVMLQMTKLQRARSKHYKVELDILASLPQAHNIYSQCVVNGVKFVTWQRDQRLKTQNCGVMVESEGINYYGILEAVVELLYVEGMSVVLFKCRWYDTESAKVDHGLLSLDTSTSCFEDAPFILASTATQVFYLDDPKAGEPWRVVNVVAQRGTYNANTLARDETTVPLRLAEVDEAYQEPTADSVPYYIPIDGFALDFGDLPDLGDHTPSYNDADDDFHMDVDEDDEDDDEDDDDDDDGVYEDDDEEDEEGDEADEEQAEDDYDDDFLT